MPKPSFYPRQRSWLPQGDARSYDRGRLMPTEQQDGSDRRADRLVLGNERVAVEPKCLKDNELTTLTPVVLEGFALLKML